jgi:uncharacterized membrane protein YhfC
VITVSFGIQFLLLIAAPIILGFWFNRRLGLPWGLFFGGALAFIVSWVITNFLPLPGQLHLLISSITQMGALYVVYRFQLKTVQTEREALMVGLGQGGIELILVGVFVALTFVQMLPLRNATEETLISLAARLDDVSEEEVQAARIDELREFIDDYWNAPWYGPLLQSFQPLATLVIQTALAVIVLGALIHNNLRPLVGAMALHFLSRILPILGGVLGGIIVWSVLFLLCGGIALWFLRRLWPVIQEQTAAALQERRKAEKRAQGAK